MKRTRCREQQKRENEGMGSGKKRIPELLAATAQLVKHEAGEVTRPRQGRGLLKIMEKIIRV